jgi:hypothetical protein
MDETAVRDLQGRLENLVREQWSARDPEARVISRLREGGKIDLTIVSRLFAGQDGLEREALFWPVFASVPKSELIYMTYCLLLTPEEAEKLKV